MKPLLQPYIPLKAPACQLAVGLKSKRAFPKCDVRRTSFVCPRAMEHPKCKYFGAWAIEVVDMSVLLWSCGTPSCEVQNCQQLETIGLKLVENIRPPGPLTK